MEMRQGKGNRTIDGQEKGVAKARHTVIDIESQLLNIGSNVADMKTAYVGRQLSVKTGSNFGTSARGMAKIQKSVESPREFHSNISDIDFDMDADLPGRIRLAVITDSGTKIVSAGCL